MLLAILFSSFLLLTIVTQAGAQCDARAQAAFGTDTVVPDVVDQAPTKCVTVTFGAVTADLGNELTPTQTANAPTVVWQFAPGRNRLSTCYYSLLH